MEQSGGIRATDAPGDGLPDSSGAAASVGSKRSPRSKWTQAMLAMIAAVVLQAFTLPCLCEAGTVKTSIAGAADVLIVCRCLAGWLLAEKGRGWLFYAVLPFALIPLTLIVVEGFGYELAAWLREVLPYWWPGIR